MTTPLDIRTPDGTPRGGVVVIQEAFGITDHIIDICQRLPDAGWVAVAPQLFHRQTAEQVHSYTDMNAAMASIGALQADEIDADVDAALSELAERGFEPVQTAIVGFCMGGSVAFATAVRRQLGAAVSFYGGGIAQGRFGYPALLSVGDALQTPWHGFFGDRDTGIPVDEVESLRAATNAAPVSTDITRFPDAEHGFNCNDRPAVYNADAAATAWAQTLAWFDGHVAR